MSNYSKIYWLTRLDNIHVFLAVLIGVCFIAFAAYLIMYFNMEEPYSFDTDKRSRSEKRKDFIKSYRWLKNISLSVVVITCVVKVFLPSKNDMILILVGGKTLDYAQSDTNLNKLPYQTTKFISDYLDKQIKEIKN